MGKVRLKKVKKQSVMLRGGPFNGHNVLLSIGLLVTLPFTARGMKGIYKYENGSVTWQPDEEYISDLYSVGDKVILTDDIIEYPSGDSPGGVCATKGEILIVREVRKRGSRPIFISHENRLDNSFCVSLLEINPC